jgi:hypothetical protein
MEPQTDKDRAIEQDEKGLSVVDEAKKLRDELKAENEKRKSILAQEQKLQAERMLSGSGAIVQPTPPKVESAKEYAEKVMGYKPMGYKKNA